MKFKNIPEKLAKIKKKKIVTGEDEKVKKKNI